MKFRLFFAAAAIVLFSMSFFSINENTKIGSYNAVTRIIFASTAVAQEEYDINFESLSLPKMKQYLETKKKELEADFKELEKARENLENDKAEAKTHDELARYNGQVAATNENIQQYDQKRLDYENKVEQYNVKLNKVLSTGPEEGMNLGNNEENKPGKLDKKEPGLDKLPPGKSGNNPMALNAERKVLAKSKENIDSNYKELMKEKAELDKQKKNRLTLSEINALNKKTKEFNKKIKSYEDRRKALDSDIDNFNKRVDSAGLSRKKEEKAPDRKPEG